MRKAPGIDGVTNEHIAFASDLITKCLCKLYNTIMTSGTVLSTWNLGLIVPIYKGGDKLKILAIATDLLLFCLIFTNCLRKFCLIEYLP